MRRLLSIVLLAVLASAAHAAVNGKIAYDRRDPASPGDTFVYTSNQDGSGERLLVDAHSCCPAWSHDGTRLAVPTSAPGDRITTATVQADGSGFDPFALPDPTLNIGCAGGAWAPDDATLACQSWDNTDPSRNGIYLIAAADGTVLARLSDPQGGLDEPGAYSPDGNLLLFLRVDAYGNSLGLFTLRPADGDIRRITPPGTIIQDGNTGDWSPDGNWIVFSRHTTSRLRGSLWLIHPDGSGLHELHLRGLACGSPRISPAGHGCHEPRWSPDGRRIVFGVNSPMSGNNVYTAAADGSDVRQVTFTGDADNPTWGAQPTG